MMRVRFPYAPFQKRSVGLSCGLTAALMLGACLTGTNAVQAQQVVANGSTQTASGAINTGALAPPAGYGLYALNNGIIDSFTPLSVTTGGAGSDAAHAQSGGHILLFGGSSVSTTGGSAAG